jgi:hypothetical protein
MKFETFGVDLPQEQVRKWESDRSEHALYIARLQSEIIELCVNAPPDALERAWNEVVNSASVPGAALSALFLLSFDKFIALGGMQCVYIDRRRLTEVISRHAPSALSYAINIRVVPSKTIYEGLAAADAAVGEAYLRYAYLYTTTVK